MITYNKLEQNLKELQISLPKKPAVYTSEFPKTISEALTKYANQRTVNTIEISVYNYNSHGWPVPLYVDNSHIRVGFMNNIFYRKEVHAVNKGFRKLQPYKKLKKKTFWNIKVKSWRWVGIPISRNIHWKDPVDAGVIEIFQANRNLIKNKFLHHRYLQGKETILKEIFSSYRKKNWASCIYTLFPLLDNVARQVLGTDDLKKDMQGICKLFSQIGIGDGETDVLMAHTNAVMLWNKVREKE